LRRQDVKDVDATVEILLRCDITIIVDDTEKSSNSLIVFWQDIFKNIIRSNCKAKLIFVGKELQKWFAEAEAFSRDVKKIEIKGFKYDEFIAYVGLPKDQAAEARLQAFFIQTGGLPVAAALLKTVLEKHDQQLDIAEVVADSAEKIQNVLFANIMSNLDPAEREFVEIASVFSGAFSLTDLNVILDQPLRSSSNALRLIPKCVISPT
jgi:hypothetical protein